MDLKVAGHVGLDHLPNVDDWAGRISKSAGFIG
jgi:hypothetical protein